MNPEQRLSELGIVVPTAPAPVASYVAARRVAGLLYVSGQGPFREGKPAYVGKLGVDLGEDEGIEAARMSAINALAVIREAVGSLTAVRQVVKLQAWVACSADFTRHPFVVNGASELLLQVFGEAGRHARSAVGTNVLPFDIPVEVELIVELESLA